MDPLYRHTVQMAVKHDQDRTVDLGVFDIVYQHDGLEGDEVCIAEV